MTKIGAVLYPPKHRHFQSTLSLLLKLYTFLSVVVVVLRLVVTAIGEEVVNKTAAETPQAVLQYLTDQYAPLRGVNQRLSLKAQ